MNWYLISPESESDVEHQTLEEILTYPFAGYHVRKPNWSSEKIYEWIKLWPEHIQRKFIIHEHINVADAFPVAGFHYSREQRKNYRIRNKINRLFLLNKWNHLSASFHHYQSLADFEGELTHAWISPIYQSISKALYKKEWPENTWEKLSTIRRFTPVALGGIAIDKKDDLIEKGFKAAALKGVIWQAPEPLEAAKAFFNTLEQ